MKAQKFGISQKRVLTWSLTLLESCAVGSLKTKGCVCVCIFMCMIICVCICTYMYIYTHTHKSPIYSVYDFTLLMVNSSSLVQSVSWGKDDLLLGLLSLNRWQHLAACQMLVSGIRHVVQYCVPEQGSRISLCCFLLIPPFTQ